MKKYLFLFLILSSTAWPWRSYDRFYTGATANAVGGAFIAEASGELAAAYNPAGLVQLKEHFTLSYEVYSGVIINDLLATSPRLKFDSFPFLAITSRIDKLHLAFSSSTLFADYDLSGFSLRHIALSAGYSPLEGLSFGVSIGPALALERDSIGWGFAWQAGLLWKITTKLQWGLAFHSPISVKWTRTVLGNSLSETFPWIIDTGFSFELSRTSLLFFSAEFLNMDGVRFTLNNIDDSPHFLRGAFTRLHPHLGFRFLEPITGAHISLGFKIDSEYFDTGSRPQYQLTAGVRFFGHNAEFNAALIDSLVLSLLNPENTREEQLFLSVSLRWP